MKKYLFLLTGLLFSGFAFAQQKKPAKKPVPLKVVPAPPPVVQESAGTIESPPIVMPANAVSEIRATDINGNKVLIPDMEAFANTDLAQLKTLSFSTMLSNKTFDRKILQKILDKAVQLETLEIKHFAIEQFPEIKMPNHRLKKLVLDHNKLNSLPESISNLKALEDLSSSNPLKELPASFATLKNMKELGLHYTEFAAFPKSVFSLNKLVVLYVSGQQKSNIKIKELPDLFQKLPELKELGVTNAVLAALPKSISGLKQLTKVDFSNNQFSAFPEVLAASTRLEYVPFTNNPLQWNEFLASVKKIKWRGLFFLYETGLSKKQYETVQSVLSKTDVYYDGMND